jgi:hypothetical protein
MIQEVPCVKCAFRLNCDAKDAGTDPCAEFGRWLHRLEGYQEGAWDVVKWAHQNLTRDDEARLRKWLKSRGILKPK